MHVRLLCAIKHFVLIFQSIKFLPD